MSGTVPDHPAKVPLISIVIPTYNQARFLAEAIDSALNQSYPSLEVIVVDNESTDDTPSVVNQYSGRVHSIRQPNLGPSAARNRGAAESKGDIIVFLDGDDILLPDCVASHADLLSTHPSAGLVVGAFKIVDARRQPLWEEGLDGLSTPVVPPDQMLATMYGPTCGMTVRAAVLKQIGGFDESFHVAEDCDLAIRIAAQSEVLYNPIPLAEYRQAGVSLSRSYALLFDSYWRMAHKNEALFSDKRHYWSIVRPSIQDRLANLIFGKLFKEKRLGALPIILKLLMQRPSTLSCFGYWLTRAIRNRLPSTRVRLGHL